MVLTQKQRILLLLPKQNQGISDTLWNQIRKIVETGPYYSMFDVGDYTFTPYKVVWREQASTLTVAAVGSIENKCIVPDDKLMLVDCDTKNEAHYLRAILNSSVSRYAAIFYAIPIQFDPHLLQNIHIPILTTKTGFNLPSSLKKRMKRQKPVISVNLKPLKERWTSLQLKLGG